MNVAPVVLWVYARPYTAMNTLLALSENFLAKKTDLYIISNMYASDASDEEKERVIQTRNCVSFLEKELNNRFHSITVIYRDVPFSVSENMVKTIEYIFEKFDYAIFLEEDILVSTNFLNFMNSALDYYKADHDVFAVCGNNMISVQEKYETDVFSCDMFKSHGYALWKEKYDTFKCEFDISTTIDQVQPSEFYENYHFLYESFAMYVLGKHNAYYLDCFFMMYCCLHHKLAIYPFVSVSQSAFSAYGVNIKEEVSSFKQFFNPTFRFSNMQQKFLLDSSKLSPEDKKKLYQTNFHNDVIRNHQLKNNVYHNLLNIIRDMLIFVPPEALDHFFAGKGIGKIAIYGLGGVYRVFQSVISAHSRIRIAYGLDKNISKLKRELFDFDLFTEYQPSVDIDAVFVTWHLDNDEIIDKLRAEGCDKPIVFVVPFMMDFLYEQDKLNKQFKRMVLR